ncbi:MAG: toll/interleukin-1 receptor domain-containing protein [Nanoarchaeota archaeon]
MGDYAIVKPTVFISHATSDAEFAHAMQQEIEKVFANGISVFCTSSPGAIPVGTDWLGNVEQKLASAQAVIAIITPVSIERPWLWFEIGATWSKGRAGGCVIYPLCTPEIDLFCLPSPLDRLQALSMGKANDLRLLFESLIKQFGFGAISVFKGSNITKRIPKYAKVKIMDVDLNEKSFYSGKYTGYSDSELMEVIDTEMFAKDDAQFDESFLLHYKREDLIRNGKLIHYRQVDKLLDLPPGTSRRLMNTVAERYKLVAVTEDVNIVRYGFPKNGRDRVRH